MDILARHTRVWPPDGNNAGSEKVSDSDIFNEVAGAAGVQIGQVESLSKALEANPSEKGFSMERLTALRASILPAYRQPLRWGMKNPHSTYTLSLLLRYFPCLACVHSLALG